MKPSPFVALPASSWSATWSSTDRSSPPTSAGMLTLTRPAARAFFLSSSKRCRSTSWAEASSRSKGQISSSRNRAAAALSSRAFADTWPISTLTPPRRRPDVLARLPRWLRSRGSRHHHRVGRGEADGEGGPDAEAERLVGVGAHEYLARGVALADDAGQVAEIEDVPDRDRQQEIVRGRPEPDLARPDHEHRIGPVQGTAQ